MWIKLITSMSLCTMLHCSKKEVKIQVVYILQCFIKNKCAFLPMWSKLHNHLFQCEKNVVFLKKQTTQSWLPMLFVYSSHMFYQVPNQANYFTWIELNMSLWLNFNVFTREKNERRDSNECEFQLLLNSHAAIII